MAEMFCNGEDPWGGMSAFFLAMQQWTTVFFPDLDEREVRKRISHGRGPDKPPSMPQPVYDVMKRCCHLDKHRRPKFKQLHDELQALANSRLIP